MSLLNFCFVMIYLIHKEENVIKDIRNLFRQQKKTKLHCN